MNKILVTKLEGVVSNDDIPRIGEIRFNVDFSEDDNYYRNQFQAKSTLDNAIIKVLASSGVNLKQESLQDNGYYDSISGKGVVKVFPKYNLTNIESRVATTIVNAEEALKYCNQLQELILTGQNKINLDLIDYSLPSLQKLSFDWGIGLSGNVKKLITFAPNLKTIFANGNSYLTGSFSDLGELVKLEEVDFAQSGVTGTVESFVIAQRAAGRTTCSKLVFQNEQNTITFNGGSITAGAKLSWTSTTITLDNNTITA